METLFPAMLEYMESKYPIFFGSPISELGFHQLFYFHCTLEDVFTRKQWIDVYKMKIVMYMPHTAYLHKHGKALIGAAVRISKDIGKPEFKDMLEETVPDYFKAKYDVFLILEILNLNPCCFHSFPFEVENEDRVDPGYMQEK